jgi:GT2 family glycosyltransferase
MSSPSSELDADAAAPVDASPDDSLEELADLDSQTAPDDTEVFVGAGVPAVVAVVPTRDPDEWFDSMLDGLASQDYANLATLVVDAGSYDDPTPRVASRMPEAFVRRIARGASFAAAANEALGSVEGAVFYLFVHDDVQLAPDAVQALVTEAFRSNAGVVGAKLVDWNSYEHLLSVGAAVDKFGFPAPLADPSELDQAQHDAVQDVFVVSTAAMLVRADLFDDLGGFSTDIPGFGEDLDLCWRARVAGARVVVMPGAVARHAERSNLDEGIVDVHHLALRHQARVMLACYSPMSLLRVAPQAAIYSVLDALVCLFTGRLRGSWDVVTAWGWNLWHIPATLRLRGKVARSRRVPDAEVRSFQVRGSARVSQFFREARSASERRIPAALAGVRDLPNAFQEGSAGMGAILALGLLVVWLIGSRTLLGSGVPAVREFSPFGPVGDLVRGWWEGWVPSGFGTTTPSSSLMPVIAVANIITFGSAGFVRTMLVLCALPIGALGAWRMLRGAVSPSARLVTTIAYAMVAVPYDALAEGRLAALAVYAAVPWLLGRFMRASGAEPFDLDERPASRHGFAIAVILALAGAVAPVVLLVGLVMALVVGVVLLLGGTGRAAWRVVTAAVVGVGLAALVLSPDLVALAIGYDPVGSFLGGRSAPPAGIGFSDLLRLTSGSTRGGIVLAAVTVVAVGILLVGRTWRLRWGIVGWSLALVSWAVVVVLGRSSSLGPVPSLPLLLVPAAGGLTLAAGLGAESLRRDVLGGQFGWRQGVAVLGVAAFVVGVIPVFVAASSGHWGMPDTDSPSATATLSSAHVPNDRTLWIGDPDDLPMRTRRLAPGIGWALTDGPTPTMFTGTAVGDEAGERQLEGVLRASLGRGPGRLGDELAPFGVRYVVVQESQDLDAGNAPSPAVARIEDELSEQLDLATVDAATGLGVFRGAMPVPVRSTSPAPPTTSTTTTVPRSTTTVAGATTAAPSTTRPATTTTVPVPTTTVTVPSRAVLRTGDVPVEYTGQVGAGQVRASYNRDAQWHLDVAGRTIDDQGAGAPFQAYLVEQGGKATLDLRGSFPHALLLVVQLIAFCGVVASAYRARLRRTVDRDSTLPPPRRGELG